MRVNYGYSAILLVVLVACSKQIILYNEEILVAVAFVGFVIVTQRYLGSESVFAESRANLLSELQQYLKVQEAYCVELVKHHELRSTRLCSSTQMIGEACIHDMNTRCGAHYDQQVLSVCVSDQLSVQLKTLVFVQDQSRQKTVGEIVSRFRNTVWNQFRFAKLRKHQSSHIITINKHLTHTQRLFV